MSKFNFILIVLMTMLCNIVSLADNLQNGEYVEYTSHTPTQDHFFVRGLYDDMGTTMAYNNTISFKSGDTQLVWIYLNDDEIYLNEEIQALTPQDYKAGSPYHEITYNSFQFNIYLPQSLEIITTIDEDSGEEVYYVQGDRLPNTSSLFWSKNNAVKVIDGVNYDVYTFTCFNDKAVGTHFSAKNASLYEFNGALKKDATLFGIYVQNKNQDEDEGRINGDMIIGNTLFSLRETDETFFFGTGGRGVENRYMQFNRVKLYGSRGINENGEIVVNGISLNTNNQTLNVNETFKLTAAVTPANATNKTIAWSSSNNNVATVASDGTVTAVAPGSATITARTTDGSDLSASCSVTVIDPPILVTGISLNTNSLTLDVNETFLLTATITPENADNKTIAWSSSNNNVATVNNNGTVTAVAPGSATITARTTDGSNISASCSVTVNVPPILVTGISLNTNSHTLDVNETFKLTATVTPANAENKTIAWSSSDNGIATVASDGTVTAVAPGNATITARTTDGSNLSASCTVTVNEPPILVTGISLNTNSHTLDVNMTFLLTATVTPGNADNKTIAWSSSDDNIAIVNDTGLVTAKGTGNAIITATTTDGSNLSASCTINVTEIIKATKLYFDYRGDYMDLNGYKYLAPNNTLQLIAKVLPEDATNKTVSWTSNNIGVATVDDNGQVTAIAPGNVTITARTTDGTNLSCDCNIIVSNEIPQYNALYIEDFEIPRNKLGRNITVPVKAHFDNRVSAFDVMITMPEGMETVDFEIGSDMKGMEYYNQRGRVGTIDAAVTTLDNQHFIGITSATTTGYYQDEEGNWVPYLAIKWEPGDYEEFMILYVEVAEDFQGGDITVVTKPASGEDPRGNTCPRFMDVLKTCFVTVVENTEPILATSIALNQSNAVLAEGDTLQLIASVMPEDATDKTVTWSSSNANVANVDENGLITAIAPGTATITVTTNDGSNLNASCTVTVTGNLEPDGDNVFHIDNMEAFYGDIIVIPVQMNNEETILAFQTDIHLPDGFTILTDEDDEFLITPSDRLTSNHIIMTDQLSNGCIRVICYTPRSKAINGNEGDLFYITVAIPEDAGGDYSIMLCNSLLTASDYSELSIPDAGALIHVNTYIPGDVNNSHTVNVTDIVFTARYIMERNPSPFIFAAADMNGDGNITVTDIMLIANLIMTPAKTYAHNRMPVPETNSDYLSGKEINIVSGETRRVSIELNNVMNYCAFQFDLNLPDGLIASNFTLTDRAGSHTLDVSTLSDGNIRALCYTPNLTEIIGHEGALLTFDVTAAGFVTDNIVVDNIEFVTSDCQTVLLSDFAIAVNNSSAVNEFAPGKIVANIEYFNLAGQQLSEPADGVTLVVTTYTDGTRSTTKVLR